jgi:hypothetical protein
MRNNPPLLGIQTPANLTNIPTSPPLRHVAAPMIGEKNATTICPLTHGFMYDASGIPFSQIARQPLDRPIYECEQT